MERGVHPQHLAVGGDVEASAAGFHPDFAGVERFEVAVLLESAEDAVDQKLEHPPTRLGASDVERQDALVESVAGADVQQVETVAIVTDENQRRLELNDGSFGVEADMDHGGAAEGF